MRYRRRWHGGECWFVQLSEGWKNCDIPCLGEDITKETLLLDFYATHQIKHVNVNSRFRSLNRFLVFKGSSLAQVEGRLGPLG